MAGEWSYYRWSLYWRENGHTEVVSFREVVVILQGCSLEWREWSCYGGGQFKGGRMVMLWRCPV